MARRERQERRRIARHVERAAAPRADERDRSPISSERPSASSSASRRPGAATRPRARRAHRAPRAARASARRCRESAPRPRRPRRPTRGAALPAARRARRGTRGAGIGPFSADACHGCAATGSTAAAAVASAVTAMRRAVNVARSRPAASRSASAARGVVRSSTSRPSTSCTRPAERADLVHRGDVTVELLRSCASRASMPSDPAPGRNARSSALDRKSSTCARPCCGERRYRRGLQRRGAARIASSAVALARRRARSCPDAAQCDDEVRDRLRLAGARRRLEHEAATGPRRGDRGELARIRIERRQHVAGRDGQRRCHGHASEPRRWRAVEVERGDVVTELAARERERREPRRAVERAVRGSGLEQRRESSTGGSSTPSLAASASLSRGARSRSARSAGSSRSSMTGHSASGATRPSPYVKRPTRPQLVDLAQRRELARLEREQAPPASAKAMRTASTAIGTPCSPTSSSRSGDCTRDCFQRSITEPFLRSSTEWPTKWPALEIFRDHSHVHLHACGSTIGPSPPTSCT